MESEIGFVSSPSLKLLDGIHMIVTRSWNRARDMFIGLLLKDLPKLRQYLSPNNFSFTVRKLFIINYDQPFVINKTRLSHTILKSVQSALSDLLTTSATHGTFSRPSTKRGLILIGLELNTNAKELFEHY